MLVASTRAASPAPGVVYSGRRGSATTAVRADIVIPPTHQAGKVEWPRNRIADPRREFATLRLEPLDPAGAKAWFATANSDGRVFIFVHGFNVTFERALYSLAQLTTDSGVKGTPVLFTWPSRGKLLAYLYDRESANFSRDGLESLLRAAADSPDVTDITLMAHSMGCWIAVEALRQQAIRDGRVNPKIHNVILAAPDLDVDVFGRQLAVLGADRPLFTVMVSKDDVALRISRLLAGGVQRVGAADLADPLVREALQRESGLTVVDLTHVRGRDRFNHSVFADSPEVVRRLGEYLADGQSLTGRGPQPVGTRVLNAAEEITSHLTSTPPVDRPPAPRSAPIARPPQGPAAAPRPLSPDPFPPSP